MKYQRLRCLNLSQTSLSHKIRSRSGDADTGDILGILAILILGGLLIGAATGAFNISRGGTGGGGTSGGITACSSIPTTTSQQFKFTDNALQGASALTSPNANLFYPNGQGFTSDNPGSLSSAFTTGGSYSLQAGTIAQVTATGAYPIWKVLDGTSATMGGLSVLTVQSTAGSTAGTCLWLFGFSQIAAPASGTSSIANVAANVISAAGTSLTGTGSRSPSTATDWTVYLNLKSTYTGAMYPITVYSTSSNTVVNYQNSQTIPPGGTQTFSPALIVSINRTNYQIQLESTGVAPQNAGLTMTQVTNTAATASTLNYVVSGFQGCAPTGGSVSTYNCLAPVFSLYQTDSGKSGHVAFTFLWIDMTQPSFIITHFTNPAVTGYPAVGTGTGIPTNFGGITVPTTAPNSGAPTVLIQQSYTVVNLQN